MAKRNPNEQSKHDEEVLRRARQAERQGCHVKADIKGYEQPDTIGADGKRPDLEIQCGPWKKIIEVETPESVDKDREQHEAFRRHAGQKPKTKFELIVTD